MVILSSGLADEDITKLNEFAETFAATVVHHFDAKVTHLIVPVDRANKFRQRTMKYMMSLMGM